MPTRFVRCDLKKKTKGGLVSSSSTASMTSADGVICTQHWLFVTCQRAYVMLWVAKPYSKSNFLLNNRFYYPEQQFSRLTYPIDPQNFWSLFSSTLCDTLISRKAQVEKWNQQS